MRKHLNIRIFGRVHDVNFRSASRKAALLAEGCPWM